MNKQTIVQSIYSALESAANVHTLDAKLIETTVVSMTKLADELLHEELNAEIISVEETNHLISFAYEMIEVYK